MDKDLSQALQPSCSMKKIRRNRPAHKQLNNCALYCRNIRLELSLLPEAASSLLIGSSTLLQLSPFQFQISNHTLKLLYLFVFRIYTDRLPPIRGVEPKRRSSYLKNRTILLTVTVMVLLLVVNKRSF